MGSQTRESSPIVPLRNGGSKSPLFLIHGVDGHVEPFAKLASYLEPDRPIYGIVAQGLLGEPVALTRMETLAAYYLDRIKRVCSSGPYHLVGYSFGGFLALEMGRQLAANGDAVETLGMIDPVLMGPVMAAEAADPAYDALDDGRPQVSHARKLLGAGGLAYAWGKLHARAMRILYTRLDGARLRIPRFLQNAYDLNWFAAVRHVPGPFPGTISLFQTETSGKAARASYTLCARLAGRGVEVYEIPGSHETLLGDPQVRTLAAQLGAWLEKQERIASAAPPRR